MTPKTKITIAELLAYVSGGGFILGLVLSLGVFTGSVYFLLMTVAVVTCFVASTVAVRKRVGRRRWLLRALKYASLMVIVGCTAMITIVVLGFMGVFSEKVDYDQPLTVERMSMTHVGFEGYAPEEVEAMRGVWMRGGEVLDSCRITDAWETQEGCEGYLWFCSAAMSDVIEPQDTISFSASGNVHQIYDMRWRVVMGGNREMLIEDYSMKNRGDTVNVEVFVKHPYVDLIKE